MPYLTKLIKITYKWQASKKTKKCCRIQYYNKGDRRSATFSTRRECVEWLADLVHEETTQPAKRITLGGLLSEYREKVDQSEEITAG